MVACFRPCYCTVTDKLFYKRVVNRNPGLTRRLPGKACYPRHARDNLLTRKYRQGNRGAHTDMLDIGTGFFIYLRVGIFDYFRTMTGIPFSFNASSSYCVNSSSAYSTASLLATSRNYGPHPVCDNKYVRQARTLFRLYHSMKIFVYLLSNPMSRSRIPQSITSCLQPHVQAQCSLSRISNNLLYISYMLKPFCQYGTHFLLSLP